MYLLNDLKNFVEHGSSTPPPRPPRNFKGGGVLKISDQNNWEGGPEQKIKLFLGGGAYL